MLLVTPTCSFLPSSPLHCTALPVSAISPVLVDPQGNSEGMEPVPSTRAAFVESDRICSSDPLLLDGKWKRPDFTFVNPGRFLASVQRVRPACYVGI